MWFKSDGKANGLNENVHTQYVLHTHESRGEREAIPPSSSKPKRLRRYILEPTRTS